MASQIFIPLTVGAVLTPLMNSTGIEGRSRQGKRQFRCYKNPQPYSEAAKKYGDQCVVLSMDVKRVKGKYHVSPRRREDTGIDALEWAKRRKKAARGDVLNSIDTIG